MAPIITELTPAQSNLLADVERMARLSDQISHRQRLCNAAPDFINCLAENSQPWALKNSDCENSIAQIWPTGKLICELDEDYVHPNFKDIKIFDVSSSEFNRDLEFGNDLIEFFGNTEITERGESTTYEDDDGEEQTEVENNYISKHFVVLSQKVAISSLVETGEYTDEDYDGNLEGMIYLCENAGQMQGLIREKMSDLDQMDDLEVRIEHLFGGLYEPPLAMKPLKP